MQQRMFDALTEAGTDPIIIAKRQAWYRRKQLNRRADNIARTEVATAWNRGLSEAARAMQASGEIEGTLYYTMPLVHGLSLDGIIPVLHGRATTAAPDSSRRASPAPRAHVDLRRRQVDTAICHAAWPLPITMNTSPSVRAMAGRSAKRLSDSSTSGPS